MKRDQPLFEQSFRCVSVIWDQLKKYTDEK